MKAPRLHPTDVAQSVRPSTARETARTPSTGQALVVEERPEAQFGGAKGPAARRPRAGEGMDGV